MNFGASKEISDITQQSEPVSLCSVNEILSRQGPISSIELVQTCIEEAYALRASDIQYQITVDNGHITITAPNTVDVETGDEDAPEISVTR